MALHPFLKPRDEIAARHREILNHAAARNQASRMPEQLQFPFPSLDFPGRATLTVTEMAERIGVSDQTILNLADEGEIPGIDLKGKAATRRCLRVPIEGWRNFILKRLTGPMQRDFLRTLPKATLRDLHRDIGEWLRTA